MFLSSSTKTRASGRDTIKDLSHFCKYKMLLIVYALAKLIDGVGMLRSLGQLGTVSWACARFREELKCTYFHQKTACLESDNAGSKKRVLNILKSF